MKIKLLGTLLLSSTLLLVACSHNDNDKKNNDPEKNEDAKTEEYQNMNKENQQSQNENYQQNYQITADNNHQEDTKQITPEEAAQIVDKRVMRYKGSGGSKVVKTDASNYYVEFIAGSEIGAPLTQGMIVNKFSGEITGNYDAATPQERKGYKKAQKRYSEFNSTYQKNEDNENSVNQKNESDYNSMKQENESNANSEEDQNDSI